MLLSGTALWPKPSAPPPLPPMLLSVTALWPNPSSPPPLLPMLPPPPLRPSVYQRQLAVPPLLLNGRKLELYQERRCRNVEVASVDEAAAVAWAAAAPMAVARTSAARTVVAAAAERNTLCQTRRTSTDAGTVAVREHLRMTAVDHAAVDEKNFPNSRAENFHRRHEERAGHRSALPSAAQHSRGLSRRAGYAQDSPSPCA
ncbi:unnamed protein product [Ectocarpus sp. CCAP 1310/34]|nr:unnamed protein product [Ectocarpus sp. CCAP 1310/34]